MMKQVFAIGMALVMAACGGGGDDSTAATGAPPDDAEGRRAASANLVGQAIVPVNTATTGDQVLRAVAPTADGGFTVAWSNADLTLVTRHYDSAGNPTGPEVRLALVIPPGDNAAFAAANSVVGLLSDGGAVVAYPLNRTVERPGLPTLSRSGIYVQRFDARGVQRVGETELVVREQQPNYRSPSFGDIRAIGLASGGFVVGWADIYPSSVNIRSTFYHRVVDSQDMVGPALVTGEISGFGVGASHALAADAQGGYTVSVFRPDEQQRTTVSVTHRDAGGAVRLELPARVGRALLLPLEGGRYARFAGADRDATLQMLDGAGNPQGNGTQLDEVPAAVTELMDGSFVAFWSANGTSTFQRYDSEGKPLGKRLPIQAGNGNPLPAALIDGGFAVAWTASGGGAVGYDIQAQRFVEVLDAKLAADRAKRKACLQSVRGMTGAERRTFLDSCLRA